MTGSAMAGGIQFSRDLENWASRAGFSLTPNDQDGRAVFSNINGEIRYFIGADDSGWLRVTSSHRSGREQLELAARSLLTIEKYFYGFFGSDIRDKVPLERATPDQDRRDRRFEIRPLADAGQEYLALFDDAGRDDLALYDEGHVTAVDGFGEVLARIRLSDLAVYLSHPTEEIKDSFEDPNGGTLLNVNAGEIA
jgi:hypothetical protein